MADSMTTDQIDSLIGRCIRDTDFRDQLLADPAGTLTANGYPADQDVIDKIEAAESHVVGAVSDAFNKVTGVPDSGEASAG